MKTTQETPLEATLETAFDGKPFIITGDYEAVAEQYELAEVARKAELATPMQRIASVASRAVKAVQEQPEVLTGTRAAVAAKLFDLVYSDTSYDELRQRRLNERRLQHRQRIGLMGVTRCAKHEKALKAVR